MYRASQLNPDIRRFPPIKAAILLDDYIDLLLPDKRTFAASIREAGTQLRCVLSISFSLSPCLFLSLFLSFFFFWLRYAVFNGITKPN